MGLKARVVHDIVVVDRRGVPIRFEGLRLGKPVVVLVAIVDSVARSVFEFEKEVEKIGWFL